MIWSEEVHLVGQKGVPRGHEEQLRLSARPWEHWGALPLPFSLLNFLFCFPQHPTRTKLELAR
jgi:hypothetical protein